MRMTIHNGRAGKDGAYNPRHNDRQFDISHAEHIDPERVKSNIYWNWTGDPGKTFEAAEAAFYEEHCREYLDAVNRRHREQRHPERVRDMDAYRTARQTCPEETLFMIGNRDEYLPPKTLRAICEKLKDWEESTVSGLKVLDMALHVDEEGAPHIHMRKAWIYRDENGIESIAQNKALQAAGIPLPHPDKPAGRHNNRKQNFSAMERQALYEICRGYGLESLLETKPREKSRSGRELEDYKASEAEKRAQAAEMRARMAEERANAAEMRVQAAERAAEQARRELNTIQAENQKLQQQNSELQKQVEELQADRKWNQDSLKMLVEARSKSNKQLKGINSAIKQKQHELEAIKGDLEEVKDYLTEGQQNRLAEIDREW